MKISMFIVIALLIVFITADPSPPYLDKTFSVRMQETFVINKTIPMMINSYMYYDADNTRERIDRSNGQYDFFCSNILPNVTTACTHLVVNQQRYVIYPQKRQCCRCCDSKHGCGIWKRDWLQQDSEYLGKQMIDGTQYQKWNKNGMGGYNTLWVTNDDQSRPRKLDQGGSHITNYFLHTYKTDKLPESVFNIPSYCTGQCPKETICGKLRSSGIFMKE